MTDFSPLLSRFDTALAACAEGVQDSRRIFHGRGHLFTGLESICVDLFQPVVLMTLFTEPPEDWQTGCCQPLLQRLSQQQSEVQSEAIAALVVQHRYREGAPSEVLWSLPGWSNLEAWPEPIYARRGGLRFQLQLGGRQNSGFFLDMEPGRQWLEARAQDKKILNLFAYTCAFSVVAVAAGADKVVNVDMSRGALSQGRFNHQLNDLAKERSQFLAENIMKSWGRIRRPGPYDLVIFDPPSYQKGSFVARKDYARLVRRVPELLKPGGEILACLNAPELDVDFLRELFLQECPACEFVERLSPSVDFADVDANRQLKLLVFRYQPDEVSR